MGKLVQFKAWECQVPVQTYECEGKFLERPHLTLNLLKANLLEVSDCVEAEIQQVQR